MSGGPTDAMPGLDHRRSWFRSRVGARSRLWAQSDPVPGLQRGWREPWVESLELGEVDAGVGGDRAEGLAGVYGPELGPWGFGAWFRGVGPQVQALAGLEEDRIGVGIECLKLGDGQPRFGGDVRVGVAGMHRPVGRRGRALV